MEQLKIGIVIPTYNEAKNINTLLDEIKASILGVSDISFSIFIVDENSPDKTAEIVERRCKENAEFSLTVLKRREKQGLGSAYAWAFTELIKKYDFDYIIQMDADLSHDPKYLRDFADFAKLGKYIVVGSRYALPNMQGTEKSNRTFYRKALSKFANLYISISLSKVFSDWTGGFNMYKVSILKRIDFTRFSRGYPFQIELKNMALKYVPSPEKKNVCEVPIVFVDREFGSSKLPGGTIKETFCSVYKARKLGGSLNKQGVK
jgi:dolichol-phosphate mannosyltransferase